MYVANTDSVVRFAYHKGDSEGPRTGRKSGVGSPGAAACSTAADTGRGTSPSAPTAAKCLSRWVRTRMWMMPTRTQEEFHRADILEFNPDGSGLRVFAYGIRNPVGIAVNPQTGEVVVLHQRARQSRRQPGPRLHHPRPGRGFYGWPWWYMGSHPGSAPRGQASRVKRQSDHPRRDLAAAQRLTRDGFLRGKQFPAEYSGDIFAAQHGSWNKAVRTGYEVIRVPLHGQGRASGEYQDFLTGFVTPDGNVWGRPWVWRQRRWFADRER